MSGYGGMCTACIRGPKAIGIGLWGILRYKSYKLHVYLDCAGSLSKPLVM